MALRARLVAPPPPAKTVWPWHTVKTGNFPVSALLRGDRRMEAETFLSSGYGFVLLSNQSPLAGSDLAN